MLSLVQVLSSLGVVLALGPAYFGFVSEEVISLRPSVTNIQYNSIWSNMDGTGSYMVLHITLRGCITLTLTLPICAFVGEFCSCSWDSDDFSRLVVFMQKANAGVHARKLRFLFSVANLVFSQQQGALLLLVFGALVVFFKSTWYFYSREVRHPNKEGGVSYLGLGRPFD
jgi:hypothetical protein